MHKNVFFSEERERERESILYIIPFMAKIIRHNLLFRMIAVTVVSTGRFNNSATDPARFLAYTSTVYFEFAIQFSEFFKICFEVFI
jgi:hypothetical protein